MLWAVFAAIPAVGLEWCYRRWPDAWLSHLWFYAPLSLAISYGVYRMVTMPGTTLVDAFIVWALAVMGLRVFVSVAVLGDQVNPGTWAALALVVVGRIVQVGWRP